jgi:tripartite-type tricarboxylate transporter receptor subunit TctC
VAQKQYGRVGQVFSSAEKRADPDSAHRIAAARPKMISRRQLALSTGLVLSGLANAKGAETNHWVVPFPAGSAQDMIGRFLAPYFARSTGNPLIIQNKAGAGGTIGAAHMAKSQPDGRTLLLAASSHHLAGALLPQLPYHPLHSFRAAAFLGFSEFVLVASANMQVASLGDFVKRAAASPGSLNFASSGNGSATHVCMAAFLVRAGLELTHIPFKSTGETVQELLAGRIQAAMLPTLTAHSLQAEARLVSLALTGFERSVHLPQLPTVAEWGYPGFQWISWAGFLAPKAVPDATIQSLHDAMRRVLTDPEVKRQLQAIGVASSHLSPEQFDHFLQTDWAMATAATRQLKLHSY